MHIRSLLLACSIVGLSTVAGSAAYARQDCYKEFQAEVADMPNVSADLAATADQIKQLQQAGLDANHYVVEYNNAYVLLTVKFHDLVEKTAAAHRAAGNCSRSVTPYRKMADVKMIYDHYGLNEMMPPAMEHSDYLTVVRGGAAQPGAFMPQAEPAMQSMAIPEETVRMMKKPYCIFGACS